MPPTALFFVLSWMASLGQYQSKVMLGIGAGITFDWLFTGQVVDYPAYFSGIFW